MVFGYLDPVTGSALLQAGLAALAAVGLGWQYVRKGSRAVWAKVRKNGAPIPDGDQPASSESN